VNIKSENEIIKWRDETFVFFNKEYAPFYYDTLIEICAKYGFAPKIVHESNNISSIIQLVKNGLGISIVPTNIVKSHNYPELGFLELKKLNYYTDILLATPKLSDSEIAQEAITFLLKN
jgi:DNA-binding transcriptional LysR family regulator